MADEAESWITPPPPDPDCPPPTGLVTTSPRSSPEDPERAARLWGAAEALHEATGYPKDPISHAEMEPYLASGRSQIHEVVWEKAWEEGRTMTLEEAVSYALE